jgi:hypothetical protein
MFGTTTPTVTLDPGVHNDTIMPDLSSYFRTEGDTYQMNDRINPEISEDRWNTCTRGTYSRFFGSAERMTIGKVVASFANIDHHREEWVKRADEKEAAAVKAIQIIGERLIQESNDRNWCHEFDEIIDDVNNALPGWLQLPTREREYEVRWTETYTITVSRSTTVTAHNDEQACEIAADSYVGEADDYEIRDAISCGNYEFSDDNGDFEAEES